MATITPQSILDRTQKFPVFAKNALQSQAVKQFLAEFIGTFLLIAIGDGAVASYLLRGRNYPTDVFAVCYCFGIGALIGISASASISGGHINPAVTVALATLRKFPWSKVWYYLLGQYLGGLTAAGVVYLTYLDGIKSYDSGIRSAFGNDSSSTGSIFATYPAPFLSISGALIDQIIGTALLMFAILTVTSETVITTPKGFQPTVLALVLSSLCVSYGLNCGAILNPARDFAPRLFTTLSGYGWEPFQPLGGHYWWVAGLMGPHLGAVIGGWLYNLTIDQQAIWSSAGPSAGTGGGSSDRGDPQQKEDSLNINNVKEMSNEKQQNNALTTTTTTANNTIPRLTVE